MKQVQKTADIVEHLKAAFGADISAADYAVFEVTALNNLPIRQKHPLYEGAIAQDSLLAELVVEINRESVPLQVMHNTRQLPVGRVFFARKEGGEARALIALSNLTQPQLIADLDAGIIDQVSVNVLPKQILCSECSFDYLSDEASFEQIYLGECGNGHKLREGGVHAKLHGLDMCGEISLVHSGGAQGARVHGRDKQIIGSEAFQRLAASGRAPELFIATLTVEGPTEMDLSKLVADLTTEKATVLTLTAERDTARTEVTRLTAELETARTNLAAAVTARDQAVAAAEEAKKVAAPTEATLTFLKDLCRRSLIATGDQDPTVPETAEDLVKTITEAQAKLSAIIPAGGAALSADNGQGADATPVVHASSAFSRRA